MGRVLEPFDDDRLLPTFGFGDITTKGSRVFPFLQDRACVGFDEARISYPYLLLLYPFPDDARLASYFAVCVDFQVQSTKLH